MIVLETLWLLLEEIEMVDLLLGDLVKTLEISKKMTVKMKELLSEKVINNKQE